MYQNNMDGRVKYKQPYQNYILQNHKYLPRITNEL